MFKSSTQSVRRTVTTGGFTLVETLVAITILLLVIIGPISIAARGLQMSYQAGNELTAIFLAQEALESVIQLRDEQALVSLKSPTQCTGSEESFGASCTRAWLQSDADTPTVATCIVSESLEGAGCNLLANGEYASCGGNDGNSCFMALSQGQYVNASPSSGGAFQRMIKIVPIRTTTHSGTTRHDTALIQVEVSWSSGVFGNRSVTLQSYLYDHYDRFQF